MIMEAIRANRWILGPRPGNPRNSEGAFITLNDGNLAFFYSAFRGQTARDYTTADIARIVSFDKGITWSEPETVLTAEEHSAMNIMSVSLLRMQNGDLGLFYLVRKTWYDMVPVLRRSCDEGKSFGIVEICSPRRGYFVMNNDRVLRLNSGRIIIPLAEHTPMEITEGIPKMSGAAVTCMYSDDDGKSWQESASPLVLQGIRACKSGLQEPGFVQLRSGVLYGWARTDLGVQYEFHSLDCGAHLTVPVPSPFTSPLSPMSIKHLPDGRMIAIWNPIPEYQTRGSDKRTGGRTPLVFAISNNDGNDWSEPRCIEADESAGYCYTAIYCLEDRLLLAYCSGSTRILPSCLNETTICSIAYDELETEQKSTIHPMGIGFN